jgi:excisionase family DNA binding protein
VETLTNADRGRLLTVKETAALLDLHPMTFRRKIERGEIPALRLGAKGTSIRVDEAELESWLYADDSSGYSSRSDPAERRAAAPAHRGAAARGEFG